MGVPWDGAEREICAHSDPLIIGRTEDAVCVKLGYVGVGTFNRCLDSGPELGKPRVPQRGWRAVSVI
jgi:hypothetical protein